MSAALLLSAVVPSLTAGQPQPTGFGVSAAGLSTTDAAEGEGGSFAAALAAALAPLSPTGAPSDPSLSAPITSASPDRGAPAPADSARSGLSAALALVPGAALGASVGGAGQGSIGPKPPEGGSPILKGEASRARSGVAAAVTSAIAELAPGIASGLDNLGAARSAGGAGDAPVAASPVLDFAILAAIDPAVIDLNAQVAAAGEGSMTAVVPGLSFAGPEAALGAQPSEAPPALWWNSGGAAESVQTLERGSTLLAHVRSLVGDAAPADAQGRIREAVPSLRAAEIAGLSASGANTPAIAAAGPANLAEPAGSLPSAEQSTPAPERLPTWAQGDLRTPAPGGVATAMGVAAGETFSPAASSFGASAALVAQTEGRASASAIAALHAGQVATAAVDRAGAAQAVHAAPAPQSAPVAPADRPAAAPTVTALQPLTSGGDAPAPASASSPVPVASAGGRAAAATAPVLEAAPVAQAGGSAAGSAAPVVQAGPVAQGAGEAAATPTALQPGPVAVQFIQAVGGMILTGSRTGAPKVAGDAAINSDAATVASSGAAGDGASPISRGVSLSTPSTPQVGLVAPAKPQLEPPAAGTSFELAAAGAALPDTPEPAAAAAPQLSAPPSAPAATTPGEPAPPPRANADTIASLAAEVARKLDARTTRFELQLDPIGLGQVQVSLEIQASGEITAHLQMERAETAVELRGRSAELRIALEGAGFSLGAGSLSFDSPGGRSAPEQQQAQQQQQRPARAVFAAAETLDTPPPIVTRAGRAGVDVRI